MNKPNTTTESKPVTFYEVFVSSRHSERKWKITVEASGHTHAYQKAKSIHNVTVLCTRQLIDKKVYH